jgi:hypothetical protein
VVGPKHQKPRAPFLRFVRAIWQFWQTPTRVTASKKSFFSLLYTMRAGGNRNYGRLESHAGGTLRPPGPGPPCPRSARVGAGPGRKP